MHVIGHERIATSAQRIDERCIVRHKRDRQWPVPDEWRCRHHARDARVYQIPRGSPDRVPKIILAAYFEQTFCPPYLIAFSPKQLVADP
jgi:hypothetical protein